MRGYPDWFYVLGQGQVLGVPTQLWISPLSPVLAAVVLAYTTWGRATYAIGSNEVAARFSGLQVDWTKIAIYSASGFAAAHRRRRSSSPGFHHPFDMGTGIELDAITAVVLGGTSIFGGRGTMSARCSA